MEHKNKKTNIVAAYQNLNDRCYKKLLFFSELQEINYIRSQYQEFTPYAVLYLFYVTTLLLRASLWTRMLTDINW
jgi:hypothetical protein